MKQDRVVVITGAAGGLGSVFVDCFLANGDTVIATDIKVEALKKLQSKADEDVRLVTAICDITKEEDCRQLADIARDKAGRVDVLVNCAGYFPIRPFEEMSLDEWRRVIDTNLTGAFLMTRAMLPLMKGRGWGRVINIGSASILVGVAGQSHYVAAKAGIVGLSRSLAREFGSYGITVNVVAPGLTMTPPLRENFPDEMFKGQRKTRAIGRDEQAEDLAGTVLFLASPGADFITGQMINVDGGSSMY